MAMLKKIGRLFQIKTRTEAWLVTYAIAVGAVERGHHYLEYLSWLGRLAARRGVHRRRVPGRRQATRFGEAGCARDCRRSLCAALGARLTQS